MLLLYYHITIQVIFYLEYDININVFDPQTLKKPESCSESSSITKTNSKNFLLAFFNSMCIILVNVL